MDLELVGLEGKSLLLSNTKGSNRDISNSRGGRREKPSRTAPKSSRTSDKDKGKRKRK
jgi:hypothetical protein